MLLGHKTTTNKQNLYAFFQLQVIGVGETLGLKIGQRRRLSDLDIAQLRDMYHCNEKDAEQRGLYRMQMSTLTYKNHY